MRYAARKDASHDDIKAALLRAGADVWDASGVGDGFPDLVVNWRGRVFFIEAKTPGAHDKPATRQRQAQFAGRFPVVRATTPEQAVAALGRVGG
jgi:hypothetical protein